MRNPTALMVASACALSVLQPPIGWSALAYAAYVPLMLACGLEVPTRRLVLCAYAVSLVYWLANLYWIAPVTAPGWVGLGFYLAVVWPILALAIRLCRQHRIPLALAFPILVVGGEALQGFPLGGFSWRFLAHSQYRHLALIQVADLCGAPGLSFVIGMANGWLADLVLDVRSHCVSLKPTAIRTGLLAAVFAAVLGYGRYRLEQAEDTTRPGPMVGAVQPNIPQSVKETFKASEEIFKETLDMSRACVQSGARLVAWPETMVQAHLDPYVRSRLTTADLSEAMDTALRDHARGRAYVLVGAYGGRIRGLEDGTEVFDRYNSAFLYRPDGLQDPRRYDKIHLVLFGERVPFKDSWPWLYGLLMRVTPYDYEYSLDVGRHYTVFDMGSDSAVPFRFGAVICYEDTVPGIARRFILDPEGRKQVNGLINISNDGWFIRYKGDPPTIRPSAELVQHMAICVFRAVENRVSILRSVNGGISCLIDSTGQVRQGYCAASEGFPEDPAARQAVAGWFTDRMPIDTRVTPFSRYGQWLDAGCAVLLGSVAVVAVVRGRALPVKQETDA